MIHHLPLIPLQHLMKNQMNLLKVGMSLKRQTSMLLWMEPQLKVKSVFKNKFSKILYHDFYYSLSFRCSCSINKQINTTTSMQNSNQSSIGIFSLLDLTFIDLLPLLIYQYLFSLQKFHQSGYVASAWAHTAQMPMKWWNVIHVGF